MRPIIGKYWRWWLRLQSRRGKDPEVAGGKKAQKEALQIRRHLPDHHYCIALLVHNSFFLCLLIHPLKEEKGAWDDTKRWRIYCTFSVASSFIFFGDSFSFWTRSMWKNCAKQNKSSALSKHTLNALNKQQFTLLSCSALGCTALYCTALHFTVLHCTSLHFNILFCTALHHTALHCTALH